MLTPRCLRLSTIRQQPIRNNLSRSCRPRRGVHRSRISLAITDKGKFLWRAALRNEEANRPGDASKVYGWSPMRLAPKCGFGKNTNRLAQGFVLSLASSRPCKQRRHASAHPAVFVHLGMLLAFRIANSAAGCTGV
jgi:hypothetical protein